MKAFDTNNLDDESSHRSDGSENVLASHDDDDSIDSAKVAAVMALDHNDITDNRDITMTRRIMLQLKQCREQLFHDYSRVGY